MQTTEHSQHTTTTAETKIYILNVLDVYILLAQHRDDENLLFTFLTPDIKKFMNG